MSVRILPSRYDTAVSRFSTLARRLRPWRALWTRQGTPTLAAVTEIRPRTGTVLAVVGSGLLMQGVGDALARTGHQSFVLPFFLLGLVIIFLPCAWRLTSSNATRNERVWVSLVLGVGLLASYIIRSPLILDGFDELAHGATLMRLLDGRSLAPTNTVLPISPYYPGLELVTIATKWLTGLPLLIDQVIVLVAARVVLVLCVFLIVERVCRSPRAGGIGVLTYAANPEFYSFDAQYAYETLALAFAVAVVYLLLASIDTPQPRTGRLFALTLGCIGAMVVTHHITPWLTIGFLVVLTAGLRFVANDPAQPPGLAQPVEWIGDRSPFRVRVGPRRRSQARVVGLAAVFGLVVGGAWTAFVGQRLFGYVGPIFETAAGEISALLGHLHGNRQLFQNAAGGGSPVWEIALMLAAAISWCLILLMSLYAVIWKKCIRGGLLRFLPAAIAAVYPLALLASVSSTSKAVGGRATTFIFFGMAVVVGGWLSRRLLAERRTVERIGTIAVAIVCFVGSTLFGGGPLPSYVPGPYLVGADERSVSAPSLALAKWVATDLPVGSHVAVDRDNGALLNDIGHVDPVTAIGGLLNPDPLFFDRTLNSYDVSLIRKADIRYIVIDTRLAYGLPLYGIYVSAGESPTTRLTLAELDKFNSVPGVSRIYDNGPIQVYDLSSLLGKTPAATRVNPIGGTGLDVGVLLFAIVVAGVWLVRLRRRGRHRVDEHWVICGLVGAMVVGLIGTFVILLAHLPPGPTAVVVVFALLAVGLRPVEYRPKGPRTSRRWSAPMIGLRSPAGNRPEGGRMRSAITAVDTPTVSNGSSEEKAAPNETLRRIRGSRSQIALGCAGLALFGIGASLATVTAQREWNPPPELSVTYGPAGLPVAGVVLGSAGPISARLEVVAKGRVLWSAHLLRRSSVQNVVLPASVPHTGSHVLLVSGGRRLREVDG